MWLSVRLGAELRRGLAEGDGEGEVVGGIVVMRYGENALHVIDDVKKKLEELKPGLPPGVRIITAYDRSGLIHRAIDTLKEAIIEEVAIVAFIIILFLLAPAQRPGGHHRSAHGGAHFLYSPVSV